MRNYYIYIITNKKNGTLYTGSASFIERRIYEHKNKSFKGSFSAIHNLDKLVYYEQCESAQDMIQKERRVKHWPRQYRLN